MKNYVVFVAIFAGFAAMALYLPHTDQDNPSDQSLRVQETVPVGVNEDGDSMPVLVAGNTACNPRVTVCEE